MTKPLRSALRASYCSVAWGALAGVAEIVVGAQSASLALAGVGATVLVDLISSVVLVWRFRAELHHESDLHVMAELRAQRVASLCLLIIGLCLAIAAVARLVAGGGAHPSPAAVVLAAVSVPVLLVLARWKYVAARGVTSAALRTDAHISLLGAGTSALTLLGLALSSAAGIRWADSAAALVVGVVAGREGLRELRGSADEGEDL